MSEIKIRLFFDMNMVDYMIVNRDKDDRDLIAINEVDKDLQPIGASIILNESLNKGAYNIIGEIKEYVRSKN